MPRSRLTPNVALRRLSFGAMAAPSLIAVVLVLSALPIASASSSAPSNVQPQTVLDAIHKVLSTPPIDHTQNHNCELGGSDPFPKVPCRHDRILPTSAWLEASRGGFKTACDNPVISTFHYYEISTIGQRYRTCGILAVWPRKAKRNQFQAALNKLGDMMAAAAGVSVNQAAMQIRGNRQTVAVSYECPTVEAGATPSGIKEVRIGRDGKAMKVGC